VAIVMVSSFWLEVHCRIAVGVGGIGVCHLRLLLERSMVFVSRAFKCKPLDTVIQESSEEREKGG
jgi:hypothetical protein